MYVLGLNSYHGDSAACLLKDGTLIAAVEEERFRRKKHWAGFPAESIRYCLGEARITLDDLDCIAVNSNPYSGLWEKTRYVLLGRAGISLILEKIRTRRRRQNVRRCLQQAFPRQTFTGSVQRIEHHLAHLGSAYLVSPFDEAVAVSVDGFGDFSSTSWGLGSNGLLRVDGRIRFPHSLGVFYQAMTQFLGFPRYGDEYKVMGLASYGRDRFGAEMKQVLELEDLGGFALNLRFFRHHERGMGYQWVDSEPYVSPLFSERLRDLLGPDRKEHDAIDQRYKDIAHSVQRRYEEAFFNLLDHGYDVYKIDKLALAGGCAMNSVANGRIRERTRFDGVFVQPAAGDAGGAIGAASLATQRLNGTRPDFVMDHAYWGPEYSSLDMQQLVDRETTRLTAIDCEIRRIEDEALLCDHTARLIAEGKVVGWFQGRMEWGPRALGNRSILCDPRRGDMQRILNRKIKKREPFRPFAPSIVREAVAEWFEVDDDVPFMMQVYPVKRGKRTEIPAVTHVDGSGRLQTVCKNTNPRFYALIEAFAGLTGVPMLLNTSFNENEPIVCRPEEALDCFLRTKMDALVLQDVVIQRR